MKYLILIYSTPESREAWSGFSDVQRAEGMGAYSALSDELAESEELVASETLTSPALGKGVAVRDGQVITTDGPFAAANEHLSGFFLVDCETLERATEIAARIPEATLGLVEVRPVMMYHWM